MNNRRLLRWAALTLFCCMLCGAIAPASAEAQGRKRRGEKNQPAPFSPEFFEQMFQGPTEVDDKALEEITVSKQDETRFGRQMVDAYLADIKRQDIDVVRKGRDFDYVTSLVNLLRPYMRHNDRYAEIDIYILDSKKTDARSFPGGTLMFYRGMLDFAENEAALVGVIGHELSHLDRGHQLVPLKQSRLFEKTITSASRGFDPQQFFNTAATMTRLMSRPFRPQDEAQADQDGAEWAYRAGYDPREMAKLFVRMNKRDKGPASSMPSFLRTHPFSLDRRDAVMKLYDDLQMRDPMPKLYIGRENLRERTPRSVKELE